ncbi:hypothetical protein Tco_0073559 [Tanacetum coccineum]
MSRLYLALNGYKSGKAIFFSMLKRYRRTPSFRFLGTTLRNTNFFRAFSASASVPAIYIQQFWNSMKYDEKTGVYCCQVDEQWFNLSADLLRKALDITPVDPAHPFELPPTGDTPWRAILTLINQCLTGKTSGGDKPRHPVLQMLWGIVTQTNVDHAELLWEEFTQGIQTFFSHKGNQKPYLEMVAKNTKKTPQDSASKQPEPATKRAPPKKPTTTTPYDEAQQEPVPQGEGDDPALELAKKMSLDAHQEKGEGEGADADIERAIKLSLWILSHFLPYRSRHLLEE